MNGHASAAVPFGVLCLLSIDAYFDFTLRFFSNIGRTYWLTTEAAISAEIVSFYVELTFFRKLDSTVWCLKSEIFGAVKSSSPLLFLALLFLILSFMN